MKETTTTTTTNWGFELSVVARLTRLLRVELAAAAAYDRALEHLVDPSCREAASKNRDAHVTRCVFLHQLVDRLDGGRALGAGPLSTFARLLESATSVFGDRAVTTLLSQAEEYLLNAYLATAHECDALTESELRTYGVDPQQECKLRIDAALNTIDSWLN